MKNFWVRTASAAVYALLFIGSMYSGRLLGNANLGTFILSCFLLFVTIGCTFEFFRMVERQGARPNKPLGYALSVFMFSVIAFLAVSGFSIERMVLFAALLIVLVLVWNVLAMVQLWRKSSQPFGDAAYTMVPACYVSLPLGLMPVLNAQYNLLIVVVLLVWANDCFAYMGGSLLGRHKLWTRHSPGKTWEGTACGVVCCILLSVFCAPFFCPDLTLTGRLVLGVLCSVVATLGDLVESMLKRSVDMKDSGNIMPGHGGFLDRFDSLLMVVPFVFVFVSFFQIFE